MNAKKLLKQAQFHGLNKLDDAKCRWVWTLSLFVLLLASTGIVASMVLRFLAQPTFITRLERVYANMEFPSVQVCPETSFPEYKIDEFLSQLNFPPDLNMSYIKSIIQQLGAFYSPDVSYTVRQLQRIEAVLDFNNIDVYSAAKKLTVSCEETLMRCRLFGVMRNCVELFTLEISQYGFCCVFNGRSLRSEIRKYGIHKVVPKSVYHTNSVGFRSGLMLAINQSGPLLNVDLTYKWVSIDGGHAYIDSTLNGTPLAPGTEMWLAHKLDGIHIDEDAASLDTALRGCRLSWEPLTFFPIHHKYHIDSTLNGTPPAPGAEMRLAHRLDGTRIDEDAARLDTALRGCRLSREPLTFFPIHHKYHIDSTLNGTPLAPGAEMRLAHRLNGSHIDEDVASLDTALRGCRLSWEPLTFFPIHHKYHKDSTLNGTPLAPGAEMRLAHRLDGIHIDEDAARLDTALRGCRLSREPLTFFPIYHKCL